MMTNLSEEDQDYLDFLDYEIKSNEGDYKLYLERGDLKYEVEDYEGAVADYTLAIKFCNNKQHYNLWWQKSLANDRAGNYLSALNDISVAHKLKPRRSAIILTMGTYYEHFNDYARAEECYLKAIKINPKYAEPYIFLGHIRIENDDYPAALKYLNKAVKSEPLDNRARFWRGIALGHLYRFDEAVEDFDMAIILDPKDHDARMNKAQTLYYMERYQAATAELHILLQQNPDYHAALDLLEEIEDEGEGWKG